MVPPRQYHSRPTLCIYTWSVVQGSKHEDEGSRTIFRRLIPATAVTSRPSSSSTEWSLQTDSKFDVERHLSGTDDERYKRSGPDQNSEGLIPCSLRVSKYQLSEG